MKYKSKIMVGSDQIIIDDFEMGIHLMRNKIEQIFQDVFFTDVNRLIYGAANEHCDGWALTMEVEEAWATYFEHVKGKVDLQKPWKLAQQKVEIA